MPDRSTVRFPCPTCRTTVRASLVIVGRSTPCPYCGERLTVLEPPPPINTDLIDTKIDGLVPLSTA